MTQQATANERTRGKWFIMHKKMDDPFAIDESDWKRIDAPLGYYFADPMVIANNELYYVFFEYFDYSVGKLAYYTLDANLNHSPPTYIDIGNVPHLSYPYVFKHNDKFYMIPESCNLNAINLYECTQFPDKWKLGKTLIPNIHAVDTNFCVYNSMFWLFTTVYRDQKNHFCIYCATDLFGEWKEHSIVNTRSSMNTNENITRGGGMMFERNGELIRPAQDSKSGIYGEKVILYRIDKLTPDEYIETPVQIVSKSVLGFIRATHTVSVCDSLFTMDARVERENDPIYTDVEGELQKIASLNRY